MMAELLGGRDTDTLNMSISEIVFSDWGIVVLWFVSQNLMALVLALPSAYHH